MAELGALQSQPVLRAAAGGCGAGGRCGSCCASCQWLCAGAELCLCKAFQLSPRRWLFLRFLPALSPGNLASRRIRVPVTSLLLSPSDAQLFPSLLRCRAERMQAAFCFPSYVQSDVHFSTCVGNAADKDKNILCCHLIFPRPFPDLLLFSEPPGYSGGEGRVRNRPEMGP